MFTRNLKIMFYKIENKDSEVYKALLALRTEEIAMEKRNFKELQETIGLEWDRILGHQGQSCINRTCEFQAFEFLKGQSIDKDIWVEHKDHKGFYKPRRTKGGKKILEKLNSLEGHSFMKILEVLGCKDEPSGTYQLPYMEVEKRAIVVVLDNSSIPQNGDVIEITSKEFDKLQKV